MQKRSVFTDVMLKRFVRASRIPAVHPPLIPPLSKPGWRNSGRALRLPDASGNSGLSYWTALAAKAAVVMLFGSFALCSRAGVREVGPIGLTVGDLGRELRFDSSRWE